MAEVEERYTFQEATEKLDISRSTLLNWIARAGLREAVDEQVMEYDQRAHYLTRAQLEQLAKVHRRALAPHATTSSTPPQSTTFPSEASQILFGLTRQLHQDSDSPTAYAILSVERANELMLFVETFAEKLTPEMAEYVTKRFETLIDKTLKARAQLQTTRDQEDMGKEHQTPQIRRVEHTRSSDMREDE